MVDSRRRLLIDPKTMRADRRLLIDFEHALKA